MARKTMTLCLVNDGERILLGMKKRGFGQGRWNGFGGKVAAGETIEEAARRELEEEAGIRANGLQRRGIILFKFKESGLEGNPEMEVHIFSVSEFEGEIAESDEMRPQWFLHKDIPFENMWPDDKYWFPLFLAGKHFKGEVRFDDINEIISHSLEEVEKI